MTVDGQLKSHVTARPVVDGEVVKMHAFFTISKCNSLFASEFTSIKIYILNKKNIQIRIKSKIRIYYDVIILVCISIRIESQVDQVSQQEQIFP